MDPTYIKAYIKSLQAVFATQLNLPVEVHEPTTTSPTSEDDVSVAIGMSGDVTGSIVVSFPLESAQRIASLFIGADVGRDHENFADAIGELVNMIAGNAKAALAGKRITITCPNVDIDANAQSTPDADNPVIKIPCDCDCGSFVLTLALKETIRSQEGARMTA